MIFQGTDLVRVETDSILDCHESKEFWILWDNHGVYVGRGHIPLSQTFLNYTGTDIYEVNGITITTGWHATGYWTIPINQGMFIFVLT